MKHIPQSQLKIRRQEPWAGLEAQWQSAAASLPGKLIVLDDDPTGVQTVHGVPVYTSWEEDACAALLEEESRVVFLLTNSRAMGEKESIALHRSIAENIKGALARKGMGKDQILLVLRGDSTLRGHYPAEMDTLKEAFYGAELPHGEIHIPAFFEGGRYTIHGVHYLLRGDTLIPVGGRSSPKTRSLPIKARLWENGFARKEVGRTARTISCTLTWICFAAARRRISQPCCFTRARTQGLS